MISKSPILKTAAITATLLIYSSVLSAAPLPDGTVLLIEPGDISNSLCPTGTCFAMDAVPNLTIWTQVSPGIDGGFVVGNNQLSGGQETALSDSNTTPGGLSAAWLFFGAYGTFFADNALNTFSDTSNDGVTAINDFSVAWNGTVVQLGGGTVDDYSISLDGVGGGSFSFSYRAVVPSGQFQGISFWLIARGSVNYNYTTIHPWDPVDIVLTVQSGETVNWAPDFTEAPDNTYTCQITSMSTNGIATVNSDCSGGSYTSGSGFFGQDSFEYTVTNQFGSSDTGIVNVIVEEVVCLCYCESTYPIRQVTTVGGGQSPTDNATVTTTFTGHIMTDTGLTTGGKNSVKICPGTTLDFETTATTGTASCIINSAVTASIGRLAAGDKLICTNKPDGGDVDRFSIKSGI